MNDPTVIPLPAGTVFAGVDWASADHAVCVIDAGGTVLWRHTVTHSRAGLTRLTTRLSELQGVRSRSVSRASPARLWVTVCRHSTAPAASMTQTA